MALTPQFLTPAGKAKLQEELADLKGPRREEIARRLKQAIEMGDSLPKTLIIMLPRKIRRVHRRTDPAD